MKKVIYHITVLGSSVWVRMKPDINSKGIRLIHRGEKITATQKDGDWFKHDEGWSCLYDNGNPILRVDSETEQGEDEVKTEPVKGPSEEEKKELEDLKKDRGKFDSGYTPYLNENSNSGSSFIKNARGIFGLPYQYMATADRRLPGSMFGRKYAEKIMTRLPLLLLSPGRPKFMSDYSDADKKNLLAGLVDSASGIAEKVVNEKKGKLYTFEYSYNQYYKFVNSMCSKMSCYLGINNETIYGQTLGNFKWDEFANSSFRTFTSSKESVAFYVDAETQVSQSFSNNVGESMLANKINEASDMGQELQYLLGGFGGGISKTFDKLKAENYDKTLQEFEGFTNKYKSLLPENLLNTLTGGIMTVLSGGKMMFPEIWKDSNFSTGYDVSIKLKTPDCDSLSWFINIGVPLIHLIAFVAPQQMGYNSYRSPFLIRGSYKSIFNVDMGLITNMSINKGDKARWTLNGLPTEVDVSFSIKDLYDILMISIYDTSILESFSNSGMLDFIGNLCGININKPDIRRTFDMFFLTVENKFTDLISFNRFLGVQQAVSNLANSVFR